MRIVDMKTGREASLNESPSEKEGKSPPCTRSWTRFTRLNESLSEKEGK